MYIVSSLSMPTRVLSRAKILSLVKHLHLRPFFVSSEGFGDTAIMRMLALSLNASVCDKFLLANKVVTMTSPYKVLL